MGLPEALQGMDDIDHAIYDLRFRQHLPVRAICAEVGLSSTSTVHARIKKILVLLRPDDHDDRRDTEGVRLEELRAQSTELLAAAILAKDLDAAQRALREVHALTRTTIQLYGLDLQKGDKPVADAAEINDLLDAYLQGAADAAQAQEPTGEPG